MFEPEYLSLRAAAVSPSPAPTGPATSALASAPTPVGHPDAGLFDLVASLQAVEARREECARQIEEAFDRLEPPEIPRALIWRKSDFPGVRCQSRAHLARYNIDGKLQYVYESLGDLPSHWTGPQPPPFIYGKRRQEDCERAAEIIAAVREWQAATQRAEDVAGYTEASEASDRAAERCQDLRRKIIFTRASTAEGISAKVRAVTLLFSDNPTSLDQRLQEAVATGDGDVTRWFGMSLSLDAMGLEGMTPSPAPMSGTRRKALFSRPTPHSRARVCKCTDHPASAI